MRDTRDWTGVGHIDVVDFIVRYAGIDTTGADYPTPIADWNTKLGGATKSIPVQEGALKPLWKPNDRDTYATFITRIAEVFSGFVVGFYPDGQFYYLPQVPIWFYNTSEGTFYKSRAANPAGPCYESPVRTEFIEPEANVVQLVGKDTHGNVLRSSLFVDWPSILNPNAVNFIGYWKEQITPVDGTVTCAEINRMAKVAWMQTRRRHFKVEFRADYVPELRVGRVFTLEGQPGTYRLLSYRAEYIKEGWKQASYIAEMVELGYQ
jgi:hypothetical protein